MNKKIIFSFLFVLMFIVSGVKGLAASPLGVKVVNTPTLETKNELDVIVPKGEKKQISIELSNKDQQDKVVEIAINTAVNDQNGQLIYNSRTGKLTDEKLLSVPKVVSGPSKVVVKRDSSEIVTFDIEMPNKEMTGILLGGITFLDKSSRGEKPEAASIGIINQLSLTLPVVIRQNDEREEAHLDDFKIHLAENAKTIETVLNNTQGHVLPNVALTYHIMEKNGKSIDEIKISSAQLAPHSTFRKVLSLNKLPLLKKEFVIKVTAVSDHGKWEWTEPFKLTSKQQFKTIQEKIVKETNWLLVFGLALLLGLVLIIIYLLVKMKKQSN